MGVIKKKWLFAPGPVMSSDRVKRAVLNPDICHRRPVFENLYKEIRGYLLRLFQGAPDDITVVVSGSGTAANETVLSSVLKENEAVLLVKNGVFGERLAEILKCYDILYYPVDVEWGKLPDLCAVEETLKKHKDVRLIAMVFHETSTGMINPVHDVGCLARKYGKMYMVDAISAIGGEDVNVKRDHIDFCTGVPNKALAGLPGVSFVYINRYVLNQVQEAPQRNVYLSLKKHINMAISCSQTPNTPSVFMFMSLLEVLKERFEEGLEKMIEQYKSSVAIIRNGVKELGLRCLIEDDKVASNTVTSVFLPPKMPVETFIDLLDEDGFVVYLGKGYLKEQNMFQIANMGRITPDDCQRFLNHLAIMLRKYELIK